MIMRTYDMVEDLHDPVKLLGLTAARDQPPLMERSHRHNDVELNLVETGAMTYFFGARAATFEARRLALFWGAMPHQLAHVEDGTRYVCVTIPLPIFLQWPLPETLIRRFFSGEPLLDGATDEARADVHLFRQWCDDVERGTAEARVVVLLEMEARLRRLAMRLASGSDEAIPEPFSLSGPAWGNGSSFAEASGRAERRSVDPLLYVAQIAQCLVERHAEAVRVEDIAREIGLSPNYAMALFRAHFGLTMGAFLAQYRVANAQRLLLTTDMGMLTIALEVGFGSLSRFYRAFNAQCGCPPNVYRARVRRPNNQSHHDHENREQAIWTRH